MPDSAVTLGGQVKVSSGSMAAMTGRSRLSITAVLIPVDVSNRMVPGVSSEPVPAVVGTETWSMTGASLVMPALKSRMGRPAVRVTHSALARSMLLPPPRETMWSGR